ncbi:uncharacterized protein L3040_005793 [Drepanopeziza brunnea f. sp. 'multigermtubi']|uniref:uncharacterized protein n=1 Tax=Drepanopeziza brunnea f. sp. 'multigermtubi' TaxID=698441 RepID=UPI002387875A|nr:hypothetical protein L3040_005793 [Drepanopeziza brunnea f. sp. 'multigermtubi']
MHFQASIITAAAFASTALAMPALFPAVNNKVPKAFLSTREPQMPGGGVTTPAANGTTTAAACSKEVMALAEGIQSNIDDQNNEVATVNAIGNVMSQSPVDTTLYAATQASLLGYVNKGIAIRQNNQKITPVGNGATAGLAMVAMAQMEELNLTMSLAIPASGQVDTATGMKTVETLKKDFAGGIDQNKKNLAAAMAGCTPPAAAKAVVRSI